jgi:hypothetical protein
VGEVASALDAYTRSLRFVQSVKNEDLGYIRSDAERMVRSFEVMGSRSNPCPWAPGPPHRFFQAAEAFTESGLGGPDADLDFDDSELAEWFGKFREPIYLYLNENGVAGARKRYRELAHAACPLAGRTPAQTEHLALFEDLLADLAGDKRWIHGSGELGP